MGNFYDEWLSYWDAAKEERARARKFIHEEDLEWMRTKQDYRAALVCSRQNGFITAGAFKLGEIPKGWNTGRHYHGEECMYIVEGEGFSIVDDRRYDWGTGSVMFMPYGVPHQHFNTGEKTVRYYSALGLALERFAGLAKVVQLEEAVETPMGVIEAIEKADSEVHPEYGRIVLRQKDAPVITAKQDKARIAARTDEFTLTMAKQMATGHHSRTIELMKAEEAGFKAREVQITEIMCDVPGKHSGKHSHMEACIYVLQGEGHSIIDTEKVEWKKGTFLHVQGPQTVHQHFPTGQHESQFLRTHFGLRSHFFQPIAKRVFPYSYYEFSSYL